jgi:thioredoxin reductase (NADPH)
MLGLPEESKLLGHGLSTCATCDGFFFRDHDIAVVGGGDSAVEEALFLTKFARTVTIVHRRDELRASKIMQQRAFGNPKISFEWNSAVTEVIGTREGGVTAVRLEDTSTGAQRELPAQGVFIAIGHRPNTDVFQGKIAMNDVGYIETVPGTARTSVEGVWACGDVQDAFYRQAITAAGTGCMAAIEAERWLAAQGIE